jgi:hypothetical protein
MKAIYSHVVAAISHRVGVNESGNPLRNVPGCECRAISAFLKVEFRVVWPTENSSAHTAYSGYGGAIGFSFSIYLVFPDKVVASAVMNKSPPHMPHLQA